jgi:hypothetical protein
LTESSQVQAICGIAGQVEEEQPRTWYRMRAIMTNANDVPVKVRLQIGWASDYDIRGIKGARIKDGKRVVDIEVPANARRTFEFRRREVPQG